MAKLNFSWVLQVCLLSSYSAFAYKPGVFLFTQNTPASDQISFESVPLFNNTKPLTCLEVTTPVVKPADNDTQCSQVLMHHSFGNSYGKPFVGLYTPPNCSFNRVVMNFTVTGAGRQFDRLAIMYLNDTEVWRTSTAEPTRDGIIWSYRKDVTPFLSLWTQPQKVIFDLGNLINDKYTSAFNTTLTATFFTTNTKHESSPADVILPISARKSATNEPSAFRLPDVQAINNVTIPPHTKRAIVSISACGQIDEEFWWSNVPESTKYTFGNESALLARSPFREIQLLVDGKLAGVAWPFPVIFTGGVVPGLWRPLVGIDAFDLKEYEIDITPWVSYLVRGEHSIELRVVALEDDGFGNAIEVTAGSYWLVTGKIFLWLSRDGPMNSVGVLPTVSDVELDATFYTSVKTNSSIDYEVFVERRFSTRGHWPSTSQIGSYVWWEQRLSYSNRGKVVFEGETQISDNTMSISGIEISELHDYVAQSSSVTYQRQFSYPLTVHQSFQSVGDSAAFEIGATMDRAKNEKFLGSSVFSALDASPHSQDMNGYITTNRQHGSAWYWSDQKTSRSKGTTEQDLHFTGLVANLTWPRDGFRKDRGSELYSRHVLAANNSVIVDSNSPNQHSHDRSFSGWSEFAPPVTGQRVAGQKSPRLAAQPALRLPLP